MVPLRHQGDFHRAARTLPRNVLPPRRALAARTDHTSLPPVAAHDLDGRPAIVAHSAVWRDNERQRPQPVGLAVGATLHTATLAALSDRLGADASAGLGEGDELRTAPASVPASTDVVLLDGRASHGIPTVVAVGESFVRWGAGRTWRLATRRAFGDDCCADPVEVDRELAELRRALRLVGWDVLVVDLGSSTLRTAGLHRVSVQLAEMD